MELSTVLPRLRGVADRRHVGLVVAGGQLLLWVTVIDIPGLSSADHAILGVFLLAVILWLSEALAYSVTSIIAVTLLFALGITETFAAAVSGFASTLVFFLILLMLLGNSIAKVGLDDRAARRLLSGRSTPAMTIRSLATNVFGLSFLMPSAVARAVTFMPIVETLTDAYELEDASRFRRASYIIIGHINPLASMAIMTGGGMSIISSQIMTTQITPISWLTWAVVMLPPVTALYVGAAISVGVIYPADDRIVTDALEDPAGEAPLDRDEWLVLAVMAGAVALWVVGSFTGMPTILPAVLAVGVLAAPGIGIITEDDVRSVSWGVIFVIGAMFSILEVMQAQGTLVFVVERITQLLPFAMMSTWQVVATLLLVTAIVRTMFSTASAAVIIILPIMIEFAETLALDPLFMGFSVMFLIGATTFLPFNTTAVLLSHDRGPLSIPEVFRFGVVTAALAVVVLVVAWVGYWPLVLDGLSPIG